VIQPDAAARLLGLSKVVPHLRHYRGCFGLTVKFDG
jgi:hypothetical protein